MQSKFTIGDVVKLKSGGPEMTISSVHNDLYPKTIWFSGDNVMENEFHQDTLIKIENED